jgi:predicted unusual protein kinase regulating ubiquinone biosynthesis (AarF/ABC1/UbiB family)
MQVPKDYVLLNRMVTLLLGICNTLDSQMNPLDTVRPYFQKFVLGEKGNFVELATNFLQQNIATALALPAELQAALKKVNKGELEINVEATRERNRLFYRLGQQFLYLILTIVAVVFSYLFYKDGAIDFSKYAGISGTFFLIMMWRKGRGIKF